MKKLLFGTLVLACAVSPCAAAGLELSIQDGRISIDAQDVTIRQILTEWARVGKTRIVNVERLGGGPITIKLDSVPEKQALEIILRAVPGYIAAPRDTFASNTSMYDTILIMATTTPVAAVRTPTPGSPGPATSITQLRPAPAPQFPSGMLPEPPDAPIDQQEDAAIAAAAAAGLVAVPAFGPGPAAISAPLQMPGGIPQTTPAGTTPTPTPANPWNAPVGTAQPSLAPPPPPAPAATQPVLRPRPQQADR